MPISRIKTDGIQDDAITSAKIGDTNVATADIANGSVTAAKLAADAITGAKIADDSIDSEHIVDGSIDTAHIGANQVTSAKLESNITVAGDLTVSGNDISTAASMLLKPAGTEIVNINNTGDVLVKGQGSNRAALILRSGGNAANSQIQLGDASSDSIGRIMYDHSDETMRFSVYATEMMRLEDTGLLIGTTSSHPSRLLATRPNIGQTVFFESTSTHGTGIQVIATSMASQSNNTNTAHLKCTTQGVGSWHLYGNGSSSFSSDERLKKNIETSRDGYLSDLAKLRVVKYNWKLDEDNKPKELGLIAQEVKTVFPSLVVESDDEGLELTDALSIKNSVLPIITIKAVQELKAELDAEKTKTTKLEAQVADLIARVSALESN